MPRSHLLRPPKVLVIVATLPLVFLAGIGAAVGDPVTRPVRVSSVDQLPDEGQPNHCGSTGAGQEWEQDNALAVDPTDPDHVVAAWIQDWQDAITVATSHDGGRTWSRALPKAARCTWLIAGEQPPIRDGVNFDLTASANDPWVAIGPASTGGSVAYVSSIVLQTNPAFGTSGVVVNTSGDGGSSWSDPHVLEGATLATNGAVDQTSVAVDPTHPGLAYVVWTLFDFRGPVVGSAIRMAATRDGGATWSPPRTVATPEIDRTVCCGQLGLTLDGTVVLSYTDAPAADPSFLLTAQPPTGDYRQLATRSVNGGVTWSVPAVLGTTSNTGQNLGRLAAAADGTLAVGWLDRRAAPYMLRFATSSDGGLTWTTRIAGPSLPVATSPELASVGATDNGRLALLFYDERNDANASDATDVTDLWARVSDDGGRNWRETHVAGPFDRFAAPNAGRAYGECSTFLVVTTGCYDHTDQGDLGDYQGIAGLGAGFASINVLARELPGADFSVPPTDAQGHEPGHLNGTDVFFFYIRS